MAMAAARRSRCGVQLDRVAGDCRALLSEGPWQVGRSAEAGIADQASRMPAGKPGERGCSEAVCDDQEFAACDERDDQHGSERSGTCGYACTDR